jgi:hypothetical protein
MLLLEPLVLLVLLVLLELLELLVFETLPLEIRIQRYGELF